MNTLGLTISEVHTPCYGPVLRATDAIGTYIDCDIDPGEAEG
jgi:hypothetical protein